MTDDATIREWAKNNGYQVGERGRIQENIRYAYSKANMKVCDVCSLSDGAHYAWCKYYVATPKIEVVADFPRERETSYPVVVPVMAPAPPVTPMVATEPAEASLVSLIRSIASTAVTEAPASLDVDQVRKIAAEVALEIVAEVATPKVFEIHIADKPILTIDGATHAKFESVVKIVGAGLHAYLVGPPGTGKTTLGAQVAEALGMNFGVIQCDPTMPASKLFGFVDAGGNYRGTVFRDVYENGGVFLFDEINNAHPGIIASINGAIANGHCAFPDGMVKRSERFRCMAAANTYGTGATRAFVGRNQLDAATLDRFVTVFVDIDETLEEALTFGALSENVALAKEWLAKVRGWRKNIADMNLQVIVSPRASIEGAVLLRVGFDMGEAAEMKVWKGMDKGTRDKIERGK